jgi:hypothetical protein
METMEPRAATGTLDELRPVAAFTKPAGSIEGVCACAGSQEIKKSKQTKSLWYLIFNIPAMLVKHHSIHGQGAS